MTDLMKGWTRGIAFAMAYLIDKRDEPTLAFELAKEANILNSDLIKAGVDDYEKEIINIAIAKKNKRGGVELIFRNPR